MHSPVGSKLTLALALLVPAVACSARDAAPEAAAVAGDPAPTDAVEEATETETTRIDDIEAQRMVVHTARLELRHDVPSDVAAAAAKMADAAGGFVADSTQNGVGSTIDRVELRLRIPSDRFEGVMTELRSQGELLVEQRSGEDVTDTYIDLEARLRGQKALEERLLGILAQTDAVTDTLEVESHLTRVRTEIERLEGQRRSLQDRVSLATIELSVAAPVQANRRSAETVVSKLDRALDDASRLFFDALAGMIRIFGAVLPIFIVFAPVTWAAHRAWRRRRLRLPPG